MAQRSRWSTRSTAARWAGARSPAPARNSRSGGRFPCRQRSHKSCARSPSWVLSVIAASQVYLLEHAAHPGVAQSHADLEADGRLEAADELRRRLLVAGADPQEEVGEEALVGHGRVGSLSSG